MRQQYEPNLGAIHEHLSFLAETQFGDLDCVSLLSNWPGETRPYNARDFALDNLDQAANFAFLQNWKGFNISVWQGASDEENNSRLHERPGYFRAKALSMTLDAEQIYADFDFIVRRLAPSFGVIQRSDRLEYVHLTWRLRHHLTSPAAWKEAQDRVLATIELPGFEAAELEPVRLAGTMRYASRGEPEPIVEVLGPRAPQDMSEIRAQLDTVWQSLSYTS